MQSLFGGLGSLFGNMSASNPYDAANPYFSQMEPMLQKYLGQYTNMGSQVLPQLQGQYNSLLSDPTAMMKKIGSGYQASPGFQWQVGQSTNAANNAASAGGMLGSPQEQQQLATTVNGLANQDYNTYMNQALGQYGLGLSGLGNLNQMGFNAANNMSQGIGSMYLNQAQNAVKSQDWNNQQQGGIFGGIGSMIGSFF